MKSEVVMKSAPASASGHVMNPEPVTETCIGINLSSLTTLKSEKDKEEVDKKFLAGFKEKYRKRMKAVEECSSDSGESNYESPNSSNIFSQSKFKEEINNAYLKLVNDCNEESQLEHDSCPSLLLPAFEPTVTDVNTEKITTENIGQLIKERDDALFSARMYRNRVDQLRSTNRKLYCDMHDRIDTIRNFYRNDIVEGNSRAAMCVKLAFQNKI